MFKAFPDPVWAIAPIRPCSRRGDWTCSIAEFTGSMTSPMKGADGKLIPPTNKSFKVDFCTVAHWVNGEIVDENLFYDIIGMLKQIGVM